MGGREWGPQQGWYPQRAAAAEVGIIGVSPIGSAAVTWDHRQRGCQRKQSRDQPPRPLRPQPQSLPGVGMVPGTDGLVNNCKDVNIYSEMGSDWKLLTTIPAPPPHTHTSPPDTQMILGNSPPVNWPSTSPTLGHHLPVCLRGSWVQQRWEQVRVYFVNWMCLGWHKKEL